MLRGLCVSVCFYGGAWVCRDVWGVLYACLYVCVHVDTHPKCRDVCVCVGSVISGEEVLKNGSAMEKGCGKFR